jgi:N-dimethylarginine dimethylaminohydrolase
MMTQQTSQSEITLASTHTVSGTTKMTSKPIILMCPPTYFKVEHVINPWMAAGLTKEGAVDRDNAQHQWDGLRQAIESAGADVAILDPADGLPDLVFTANAAFVHKNKAIIAHYKYPERRPEEPLAEAWFRTNGYDVHTMPESIFFEGAGDGLKWRDLVFAGYRTRSDIASHNAITAITGLPVISLELKNPKFYHIDVCMCPLNRDYLLYFPEAFDEYGIAALEATVPKEKRIPVTAEEAARFACNAVSIGDSVIFNEGSPRLEAVLREHGFTPVPVPTSEFIKSGGSSKCLTLRIN